MRSVKEVSTTTKKITIKKDVDSSKPASSTSKTLAAKVQLRSNERNKTVPKTYAELLAEYKGTGKHWEDTDFPAESTSIFLSKSSKNYREFQWKRPKEISPDAKLFTGGASRFDVQQGILGDCWLLAVVASLSMYEQLFYNVVPSDQDFEENYIGAFRFRFWKFGKWTEVIVDDRIPTLRGKLAFMHSSETNEYWSALLEKAYAKICGSYEALNGGSQLEAMEDFTGGLSETIRLNEKERPADLYQEMMKFVSQSSLMGCAIETGKVENVLPNGLIGGHAYSVTGVERLSLTNGTNEDLVRIRNPWGNDKEWTGAWSDNSTEWKNVSEEDKKRLCAKFQNDGEFWMSYTDFVVNFTKLEVCHLGPGETFDGKRRWEMSLEEGSWLKNVNAGGCLNFKESFFMNPQYRVTLEEPDKDDEDKMGTLIIGLMQKDMRKKNTDLLVIGYVVYKVKDPNCGILDKNFFKFTSPVAKCGKFVNMRTVCGRHRLPPGHYVIIPSTFNANDEADFIIRIFSETPNNAGELDVDNGQMDMATYLDADTIRQEMNKSEQELEELFKKVSGPSEFINATQLKHILNEAIGMDMKSFKGFDFEVCRSMIALFDGNHTGRMEFFEFLELIDNLSLWKAAFKEFDVDKKGQINAFQFRNAINDCGLSVSNSLFKVLACRFSEPENGVITFMDFVLAVIRLTNAFETMFMQPRDKENYLMFTAEDFVESLLCM